MQRAPHARTLRAAALMLFAQAVTLAAMFGDWPAVAADRPHVPGSASAVWEAHADECWGGGDPALADKAGAAVIRWSEGDAVYVTNPRLVALAEEEVLGSIGYGDYDNPRFDVIGLCL